MKLAGAVMIALACALGCAYVIREQARRTRELSTLCAMLTLMQRELEMNLTALPELAGKLSKQLPPPASGFLKNVGEMSARLGELEFKVIWRLSLKKEFICLGQDELEALENLGTMLGRFTLDTQLKAISSCEALISGRYREHMSAAREERRMKVGMICMGCALIFIVLI